MKKRIKKLSMLAIVQHSDAEYMLRNLKRHDALWISEHQVELLLLGAQAELAERFLKTHDEVQWPSRKALKDEARRLIDKVV